MGVADVIPGISGGTLALMLGIYERLIGGIKSINGKIIISLLKNFKIWNPEKRKDCLATLREFDAFFLVILGFGVFTAVLATSSVIPYLILNHTSFTFACFLGLISPSIYIPWKLIKIKGIGQYAAILIGLALTVIMASMMKSGVSSEVTGHDFPMMAVILFSSAVIAISAMILPGISGSFILMLLGQYIVVTGLIAKFKVDILNRSLSEEKMAALSHVQHFSTIEVFILLVIFAAGCATGLLIMSRVVHFALSKAHDTTMAFLTGMICSSFYVLWPFKEKATEGIEKSQWLKTAANIMPEFTSDFWVTAGIFAAAFALSTTIIIFGIKKEKEKAA